MLTFGLDELRTLAVELQDLVQTKVGTTAFANVYNMIRQNVLGVRRERKTMRAVQVCRGIISGGKYTVIHSTLSGNIESPSRI